MTFKLSSPSHIEKQIMTFMQYYIHRRKYIYLIELVNWTLDIVSLCYFFFWLGFNKNFKNPKYPIHQKYIWWEWCCSIRSKTTKLIVFFFNCATNASKTNSEAEGNSWKVMWSKGFCLHSSWYGIEAVEKNRMCR